MYGLSANWGLTSVGLVEWDPIKMETHRDAHVDWYRFLNNCLAHFWGQHTNSAGNLLCWVYSDEGLAKPAHSGSASTPKYNGKQK